MAQRNAPGMPSPLRPAPDQATTPLPGTFALTEDESTQDFDGGTVLLGGSPLRLFRISDRARQLVLRWRDGAAVGPRRSAQLLARRLASAGAFNPRPPASGVFGPNDVTVVIPVRDRPVQLNRLLGALDHMACVVVDDASPSPAASKVISERHGATFVGLSANVGPAGARNAGLHAVQTPLVAFIDSDCVPDEHWLEPLLGHFDDPLVAAAAPRIVPANRPGWFEGPGASLDRGTREGPVRSGSRLSFVPSAALLVRIGVATGAELFDPALRGGEDVDLVWRLGEAGWDVRYVPSSTVAHDGAPTLRAHLSRRTFYGTTAGPLAQRHGTALAPAHLSAWSLTVWALLLARRPLLALAALAASIGVLAQRLRGLVRDPVGVAVHIAGGGTARAALPALASLTRAWSPALALGLLFRRTRLVAFLALVVQALRDWAADQQGVDPVRAVAVHVADDVAYGSGVWVGCARARTLVPLIPRVTWRSRVWSSPGLRTSLRPQAAKDGEGTH